MPKRKVPDAQRVMEDTLGLLEESTSRLKAAMKKLPDGVVNEEVRKGIADNVRALAQLTAQVRIWKKEELKKWLNLSQRKKTQIAAEYISNLPSGYFREAMEIIMKSHPSVRMNKKWKEEAQRKSVKSN